MPNSSLVAAPQNATFRDPQGRLYRDGERILREIYPAHVDDFFAWFDHPFAHELMDQGRLVRTQVLARVPAGETTLEHECIFFPSFPWEWTPGEWRAAALLTLDLCEEAVEHGFLLKDATPLNVLFRGPEPIFVDVPSFERRDPATPYWSAYAQFVRSFLLPLAAYAQLGWPLSATIGRRDGYEPADLSPWLGFRQRWTAPFRSLVTLPLLLEGNRFEDQLRARSTASMDKALATTLLRRTLRSARHLLDQVIPAAHVSRWSRYADTATHYSSAAHADKREFVRKTLAEIRPARLLDVGANTGVYSRIAAGAGAEVVAWDTDLEASESNWAQARQQHLSILPLIADFARPTPAVGWHNGESASLLARSRQRFDCVLMLGILHHLLVRDQIPLASIVTQLSEISSRWAILEWVPNTDSQFVQLARGREELSRHLTEESFLHALGDRFAVRLRQQLPNNRVLFLVEKSA